MFPKNHREGSQEELEIQLRQRALKSLLLMRQKRLRETLEHRIKRGQKTGEGEDLTRADWARLHKQEIDQTKRQMEDLEQQSVHARRQLTQLKRALSRARRLRASQGSKRK
ncbi:MAG TPA: hypothetical protein VJV04_11775 [Nitrospiraceae bacterium]|jgi:hypothetical protein|nr:hypothetical protein [Nitrospirota bacterium]HKN87531.1 hypothetical protein [Nitrospiraceae bacterium]